MVEELLITRALCSALQNWVGFGGEQANRTSFAARPAVSHRAIALSIARYLYVGST